MSRIKTLAFVVLAIAAGVASVPQPADAFSAFKGRFQAGSKCQRAGLTEGDPIWPMSDIAVEPSGRATSGVSCPNPVTVNTCRNAQPGTPIYTANACTAILDLQQQCTSGAAPADLGNRSDNVYWAGLSPYDASLTRTRPRSHPDVHQEFVADLGTIVVPFDMLVRFPSVTEASPQYHWLAPIYRIGDQAHWSALPSEGEALLEDDYTHGVKQDALRHHYWVNSWDSYTSCPWCHNPLYGARGPFDYTYGDNRPGPSGARRYSGGRSSAEPVLLEKGSYPVEAGFVCRNESYPGCYGTMYQQRMRVEFVRCPED